MRVTTSLVCEGCVDRCDGLRRDYKVVGWRCPPCDGTTVGTGEMVAVCRVVDFAWSAGEPCLVCYELVPPCQFHAALCVTSGCTVVRQDRPRPFAGTTARVEDL